MYKSLIIAAFMIAASFASQNIEHSSSTGYEEHFFVPEKEARLLALNSNCFNALKKLDVTSIQCKLDATTEIVSMAVTYNDNVLETICPKTEMESRIELMKYAEPGVTPTKSVADRRKWTTATGDSDACVASGFGMKCTYALSKTSRTSLTTTGYVTTIIDG